MIFDLGSANGMPPDSVRVPAFTPHPLTAGSRLEIGSTSFLVVLRQPGAQPTAIQPSLPLIGEQPTSQQEVSATTSGVLLLTLELATRALAVTVGQLIDHADDRQSQYCGGCG